MPQDALDLFERSLSAKPPAPAVDAQAGAMDAFELSLTPKPPIPALAPAPPLALPPAPVALAPAQPQPMQARLIPPQIAPDTASQFPAMAKDVFEATQAIVRGVPAFLAGMGTQVVAGLGEAWKSYQEKGPLSFSGMDLIKALGAPKAVESGQEVSEQLSYQPPEGGAKVAEAVMLPLTALDKGLQLLAKASTPDPQMQEALLFLGRAALLKGFPEATKYVKGKVGALLGEGRVDPIQMPELTALVKKDVEAAKITEGLLPGGLINVNEIQSSRGKGGFPGDPNWSSRVAGRRDYDAKIGSYEAARPNQRHYRPAPGGLRNNDLGRLEEPAPTPPIDPRAQAEALQAKVTPVGTGKEATGLSAIESKMGVAMREGQRPGTPPQFTQAEGLRDMDLVYMNDSPIGAVEQGQGQAVVGQLQSSHPNNTFAIHEKSLKSLESDPVETIMERAGRNASAEAKMRKKMGSTSEIFGDPEAAHEAAIKAAREAESAAKGEGSAVDKVVADLEKEIPTNEPAVGLSIKQVSAPPKAMEPFKFDDPDIESRFTAAKGVRPEGIAEKVSSALTHIKNLATRTYEDLPAGAEFAETKQALKNLEKQKMVSLTTALKTLRGITVKSNQATHDLFTRKVILDDLAQEAKAGRDIPFGFDKDTLAKEVGRVDAAMANSPEATAALGKRRAVWDAIKKDYVKAAEDVGFPVADRLRKDDYYHHMVLDYAEVKGIVEGGRQLKTPTHRGFLRRRMGSELDINTDYLEAETEVMSQMLYDIERNKTIKKIGDVYNTATQVRAEAKAAGLEDWHDAIPDGEVTWQPREGNSLFAAWTIPERIVDDLLAGNDIDLAKLAERYEKATEAGKQGNVMALGAKRPEWVVPEALAKTLDNLTQKRPLGPVAKLVKATQTGWKVWTLISPRRVVKYNLRNMTGDADAAFVGNPEGFAKVPQAVKELYDVLILNKPMPGKMADWFKRGGMESTLQAQELGDIKNLSAFKNLYEKSAGVASLPKQFWQKYWGAARLGTDFREAILRYSNYLDYFDQVTKDPAGRPKNFGASLREEIMALADPKDRAFRLSNELLGSYDEISVLGQRLREYVYPFWSWKELNFKRYMRFARNAWVDGKTAGTMFRAVASRGPVHAYRIARFSVKATAFWAMLQAWNNLKYPDLEDKLPDDIKNRPHLVLGQGPDGKTKYFSQLGALGDFLQWFGLDAAPGLVSDFIHNKKSLKEIATSMAESPVNQIINGLSPLYKTPVELMLRKEFFPNAMNPRVMRDRGLYLSKILGLENEYAALAGLPSRGYEKSVSKLLYYESDPEEAAYYTMYNRKAEFLKKLGKLGGETSITPQGVALYYMRLARRLGDDKAEKKYFEEYASHHRLIGKMEGKTDEEILQTIKQGIRASMKGMHPLSGLNNQERILLMESFELSERDILARAVKYYNDVIVGGVNLTGEDLDSNEEKK
jgi:hypothetical protein